MKDSVVVPTPRERAAGTGVVGYPARYKSAERDSGGESEGSDVVEKGLDLGAIG